MMDQQESLLDALVSADNGGVMRRIAAQLGVTEETAINAARTLLPTLTGGIQRNLAQPGGEESLSQALQSGNHQRYLNDPRALEQPQTLEDGNAILGHIFGNKDVSRNAAGFGAEQSGISPDLLKKMLPLLATTVMGLLAAKAMRGGPAGVVPGQGSGGGLTDLLGGLLDANKDGSPVDDVLSLAKRFFRR